VGVEIGGGGWEKVLDFQGPASCIRKSVPKVAEHTLLLSVSLWDIKSWFIYLIEAVLTIMRYQIAFEEYYSRHNKN